MMSMSIVDAHTVSSWPEVLSTARSIVEEELYTSFSDFLMCNMWGKCGKGPGRPDAVQEVEDATILIDVKG